MINYNFLDNNIIEALRRIETYTPPTINTKDTLQSASGSVMLTGANGYLGVHIINSLMQQASINKIYCGIRAETLDKACQKLKETLRRYGFEKHIGSPLINIINIDLAEPKLGIDDQLWHELSEEIDAIYHNGAYIHHLQDYVRMAKTNVGSTEEIINFASLNKLKRIHFISTKATTVNCLSTTANEGMPCISPIHPRVSSGYTATKWAAEWLLWKASETGVPVDIYRLGQVTGHSDNGAGNHEKNHLTRLVLGCLQMGCAPALQSQHEMIPVDYVAKSIVTLSLRDYHSANGWNLINRNQISHEDYFKIIQALGYSLEIVPYQQWSKQLSTLTTDNLFYPLASYYNDEREPFVSTNCEKTYQALHESGIAIPTDYSQLQKKYFEYWQTTDFAKVVKLN